MQTIAEELPYAAIVTRQFVDRYCASCFRFLSENDSVIACDDCLEVCYCSMKCQRNDWKKVHQLECEVLRTQTSDRLLTPTMRLCIRVILQKLLLNSSAEIVAFNGTVFEDLETNYEEYRSSPEHNQFLSDLAAIIQVSSRSILSKLNTNYDKKQVIAIICSVLCNAISVTDEFRGESIGAALYLGLSKHNHACSSDSHIVFQDSRAILRSTEGTSYCKNITISYVSSMLPTFSRQKSLKNVHFFKCECKMCLNEGLDAIGLARRCIKENCKGYCRTYDLQETDEATCSKCGEGPKCDVDMCIKMTSKLLEELENVHKLDFSDEVEKLKYLQNLRENYGSLFADCHMAICQLDEQIAYCVSILPQLLVRFSTEQLEEFANRGVAYFVERLGMNSIETTRRLYISCCIFQRIVEGKKGNMDNTRATYDQALQSSQNSHGIDHPLTRRIEEFIQDLGV